MNIALDDVSVLHLCRSFVQRVLDQTGVAVEVLSGREEACLIYLGILQVSSQGK